MPFGGEQSFPFGKFFGAHDEDCSAGRALPRGGVRVATLRQRVRSDGRTRPGTPWVPGGRTGEAALGW